MKSQEYLSLRNEIMQRNDKLQSWSRNIILLVTTIWSIGLLLFQNIAVKDFDSIFISKQMQVSVLIILCILFYLPIIIIFSISNKIKDNLIQISKISSYIIVFYEINYIKNGILWETINNIPCEKKRYNLEYTYFSILSYVIFTIFYFMMVGRINFYFPIKKYILVLLFLIVSFICLSLFTYLYFLKIIYQNTSVKLNFIDSKNTYFNKYKDIAFKEKIISNDEIDAYNAICNNFDCYYLNEKGM